MARACVWTAFAVVAAATVSVGLEAPEGSCAEGVVQVKARDQRYAGQYEVNGRWGGRSYFKGKGASVLYFAGGNWVVGTTLGVKTLANRIFASRTQADLFDQDKLWENQVTGRADPAIKVECGLPKPRLLEQDTAESVAIFKTGPDRHLHNFLGVFRITSQQAHGKPVYKNDAHGGFFLSYNEQNQWILGREGDVGTSSGFAFLALDGGNAGLGIEKVKIPDHGIWQIADNQHKWAKHPDLLVSRGTGGQVKVEGRVGTNEHINGVYQSLEQVCNNRFVYEKNGGEHVLYFMPDTQQWHISSKADVCTDQCWAYRLPGTDVAIDDPEHSFGTWHVHPGGSTAFIEDVKVSLTRV